MEITKSQKKHLRELVAIAYERDLFRCLNIVKNSFDKWENNEITVWDVNDKIHQFHNDIALELYKSYVDINDPLLSVAFGLRQGVLDISEVNINCRPMVEELLTLFKNKE
ncbi:MAG: hypothetical protein GQ532_16720 [Methylomarinum sp.]|nr:hypothetical protein [Methylomarinum sp.]